MKEKKIARDTRNREKLAGDDWVMAEFYATWGPHCQRMQPLIKEFKKEMEGIVEVVQVDVDEEVISLISIPLNPLPHSFFSEKVNSSGDNPVN